MNKWSILRNDQIDREKWDRCVHFSLDGNIFGYSWALDSWDKSWIGLVEKDYNTVVPLYAREKKANQKSDFGFLSIYSQSVLSSSRIQQICESLDQHFDGFTITSPVAPRESGVWTVTPAAYIGQVAGGLVEHGWKSSDQFEQIRAKLSTYIKTEQTNKVENISEFIKVATKGKYHPGQIHAANRLMYNCIHRGIGSGFRIIGKWNKTIGYEFLAFSESKVWRIYSLYSPRIRRKLVDIYFIDFYMRHVDRTMVKFMMRNRNSIQDYLDVTDAGLLTIEKST